MPAHFELTAATLPFLIRVTKSGCWEWLRSTRGRGYGQATDPVTKKQGYAHHIVWKHIAKRNIPKGKILLHTCDNRICVRPEHITLGNYSRNNKEGWERHPNRAARIESTRQRIKNGLLKMHFEAGRKIGGPRGRATMKQKCKNPRYRKEHAKKIIEGMKEN